VKVATYVMGVIGAAVYVLLKARADSTKEFVK
jgi:hypothetical protein